jgi:hypothetical protein
MPYLGKSIFFVPLKEMVSCSNPNESTIIDFKRFFGKMSYFERPVPVVTRFSAQNFFKKNNLLAIKNVWI